MHSLFFANYLIDKDVYNLHNTLPLIFSFSIMLFSCDSDQHIRTYRLPKNTIIKHVATDSINQGSEVTWEKPSNWKEVKGHSMRLASFSAPFSEGNGDVSITTFAGASGGIGPNVNRWLGQIGLGPMSDSGIEAMAIKKIGRLGEYSYFKLINDGNVESAILASIFLLEDRTVFIKLSSTLIGIKEIESDFLRFCNSIFERN